MIDYLQLAKPQYCVIRFWKTIPNHTEKSLSLKKHGVTFLLR